MTNCFVPEGCLLTTPENNAACAGIGGLRHAVKNQTILEGIALCCDAAHNLIVSVGPFTGMIPRPETARGISQGTTREIAILSRVGKPVCFVVEALEEIDGTVRPILSRLRAQELALSHMMREWHSGTVIPAIVTHLEPFGAFVDIGCGISSLISIENISISRISHPDQRFTIGQHINAIVQETVPEEGRVYLTHKELLGTWEENASLLSAGMTVPGIVRGTQPYGIFVELAPNLSGLAEVRPGYASGDRVSVYIKSLQPERMKIKLLLIDHLSPVQLPAPLHYYITSGRIEEWSYAPAGCTRVGARSVFCS